MAEIRAESEGTAVADDLRGARPSPDRVAMDTVRARAESALFGVTAPSRLGRYLVVERLAGGGMGVVYRGYDPELHRKVALKVLHPRQHGDERAQARMIAEARALAKLDHTNVVRIHDVLDVDGQVVLVMELIEGTTLADWERETRRSWRDIVSMYLQAGHGLAAAHSVGVIHRDFKPANVIIGHDGRVRVLDFGLAQTSTWPDPDLATGSPDLSSDPEDSIGALTATGEVVGTLGYTSPEQLAGEPATPASDQFSFCVSLHRALETVPPFNGADPTSRLASIRAGTIHRSTDGRATPAWLRAATSRGLRATPSDRFPSLADLLRELGRPRGFRRWRGVLAATAIIAAAGLAIAIRPAASSQGPTCDGGAAAIAGTWNESQRSRVISALPAADLQSHVLSTLDTYRDRWVSVHNDACVVHRRGEQSDAILDRRMACLARRRVELRESLDVLAQTTPATSANAIDVVARLPNPGLCADVAHLQAESEPPTTPELRRNVDRVRDAVSRVAALDRTGRSEEALASATAALRDAELTSYAPVIAEAGLLRGRILLTRRDFVASAQQLLKTRNFALEHGLLSIAVEAGARQIYADSMGSVDHVVVERDVGFLEPLSHSLRGDNFARPLLLNNIGAAKMAAGNRAEATRYFRLAHDELQQHATYDIELSCVDRNLAMVTADDATRETLIKNVWQLRRNALGDHHLESLEALDAYARYVRDPVDNLTLLSTTCALYDKHHPSLIHQRAHCHHYRGFLLEFVGDRSGARQAYTTLIQLADGHAPSRSLVSLAEAEIARLAGDRTRAAELYADVIRTETDTSTWFARLPAGHAHLGMGRLLDGADASEHLATAASVYRAASMITEQREFKWRLIASERESTRVHDRSRSAIPAERAILGRHQ